MFLCNACINFAHAYAVGNGTNGGKHIITDINLECDSAVANGTGSVRLCKVSTTDLYWHRVMKSQY